ncbi:MAG: DUF3592 domain-containing protein [Lachnospiraceae bacterium]|nr:DUF3592 domain-containing protein [Lachnospiraceae bacterium]
MKKSILFLFIFGVAVLALGIFLIVNSHDEYPETTAVITRIDEFDTVDTDGSHTTEHTVYVDYTVDGKEYKNIRYGEYSIGFKVGKEITIKYNPENPAETEGANSKTAATWITVGGGILMLLAVAAVFVPGLNRLFR